MMPARFRPPPVLTGAMSARLDLLRLLLVLQVLLGHYAMIAYPPFPSLDPGRAADLFVGAYRLVTRFGGEAAFVFVGISGFLLGPRLVEIGLGQPGGGAGAFLKARLIRIYPTLVAALLLTAACDLIGIGVLGAEPLYRVVPTYDAVARLSWAAALGNLLSLQPVFADAFGSNGPLWTLGYIVQFYLVGALLAVALRFRRWAAAALLAGLLGAGFAIEPQWSLLLCTWLGCAIMRWFPARNRIGGWLGLMLGLTCLVIGNLLPDGPDVIAAGLAGMAWLAAVQAPLGTAAPDRLPRPLAALGAASYALYAFHYPIAMLLYAALLPLWPEPGLGFRLAWPVLAAGPAVALAIGWQALLARWLPRRIAA